MSIRGSISHRARPAGEDRCEDRPARAHDQVPDGRGDGVAWPVPANPRRHRAIAPVATDAMLRGGA